MCAILLVAVGYSIYWIFNYDDWYPNPSIDEHNSKSDDTGREGVALGAD